MHENDVELVKLLHQNCTAAEERMAGLQAELDSCKSDLDEIEQTYGARSGYSDILKQAAEVLDRKDLVVETPDPAELATKFDELNREFNEAGAEAGKYRALLDQLTDKAPDLLVAAGLSDAPEAVEEAEPAEDVEPVGDVDPAGDVEPVEDESDASSAEDEPQAVAAEAEPMDEELAELQKFNVKTIRRREKSGHGPGAVYIIDGISVLSRIPSYDFGMRSVDEQQVYEELAKDLCDLGDHISGSFCILAGKPMDLEGKVSSAISFVSPGTNGDGEPEERLHYLLRLADEYTGRLRNVCVVSGEPEVLAEVQNRGMHTMGLSEFFSA